MGKLSVQRVARGDLQPERRDDAAGKYELVFEKERTDKKKKASGPASH